MHSQPLNLSVKSMVDLIEHQLRAYADKTLYSFLIDDSTIESTLTYVELSQRAKIIGHHLQETGCRNQPLLLCFPPGLDFVEALFGCFYAGAIATPIHFPHSKRMIPRISKISTDSGAEFCLCTSADLPKLQKMFSNEAFEKEIQFVAIDEIENCGNQWSHPELESDHVAFLQYTSGSTNQPKGVVITHGNLLNNLQALADVYRLSDKSRHLLWVPATHDMGLVAGILCPPYCGADLFLMSPTTFAANPNHWLKAMTKFKATASAAPNFALDYCVERVTDEDLAQIDLSSLEVMVCGSERVREQTMERFYHKFGQAGFRNDAMMPSYGMAEATLVVSGHKKGDFQTTKHQGQTYVSCGGVHPSFDLCIVDLGTHKRVPDGTIGEVWLAGPSVSSRYWGKAGSDLANFNQRLAGEPSISYMRTGDYGFLKDGELYITGRLKELIIHNGVNYFAPDIEQHVETAHPAIGSQGVAILPVDDGLAEQIIIFVELRRTHRKADHDEVARAIQTAVGKQFVLPIKTVILIKPSQLPRTSSGKISKFLCRQYYQDDSLAELGRVEFSALVTLQSANNRENAWVVKRDLLRHEFAKLLNMRAEDVDFKRPIMQYGIDSIKLTRLNVFIKDVFGSTIPFEEIEPDSSLQDVLQILPETGGDFFKNIQVAEVPQRNLLERARQFDPAKAVGEQNISLPYFRELGSNEGVTCQMDGRTLLMFGSNNYLGLTVDPRVRQTAADAVLQSGPSATGSRLLNGTFTAHRELEEKLAQFLGREDALVFTTGYQANIGLLSALLMPNSTLFVDEYCHASIYDGAFVANANVVQFKHNDPADLEAQMAHLPINGSALVMIDGVYSMEGDIGRLPEIKAIATTKNIPVLLDDAHSLGMIGKTGRGTEEHFDAFGTADCMSGTFSKSLASIGGWVAGERAVLDSIRYTGRSMLFSASMPPPAIAAASAALDILIAEPERVGQLEKNARYWRDGLRSLGFVIGPTETAVVPVLIGDEVSCLKVNQALIDEGVYTNAAIHPAVPKGKAILRTSVLATHTQAHLDQALTILGKVKQKMGL